MIHYVLNLLKSRTIIALGHLVMSCDQTLYVKLINILLEELENPQVQNQHSTPAETASNIRTYIQVRIRSFLHVLSKGTYLYWK